MYIFQSSSQNKMTKQLLDSKTTFLKYQANGYGTVCTKTSSSWDDSHKQIFFTGMIHPGRFAQMVKKWNKKFLIENFKLQ